MAFNDRELLARIIKCEAGGEGDSGMRAVATVVMNRVHVSDGEYQRLGLGNLRRVIFQPGQFDCVREFINGQYNPQNIFNMTPDPVHYQIADWALGGSTLGDVGHSLWYFNPYGHCIAEFPRNGSGSYYNRVQLHCFYLPTPLYYTT